MKRGVSLLLAVSGLFSWSAPSYALKPAETVEGSGLEELDQKLRSEVSSASGLEELGIGSLPTTHQIDTRFTGQFLSGRVPTGKDTSLLETQSIPHAQLATEWIGVVTVFEDLIGAGRGLDTVRKRGIVDRADLRAQEVQDQVARAQGILLQHVNFETKGLTPGGLQAGAVGGDPQGKPMPTISDVIEHTTAFMEGDPGASSMQMEGPGAETFGSFPDEARALMVVTRTDPAKEAAVLRRYGVQTVDEFLDPELPVDQLVRRVAELNGVHSNQVDVTLLTNDDADLEALRNLQQTYTGLRVHQVKAGTVVPALAAVLGVNDGRVRLFLRRSGMTEGVFITLLAGLYSADGSYANFRVVSEEVKSEFSRRYVWNQRVLGQMEALRPNDWTEIRDGKKIFSSRQATLPITATYTFLTNGRTDLDLPFSVDGVRQDGGVSAITSLIFTSNPGQPGAGYLWLSKNSYSYTPSTTGLEENVLLTKPWAASIAAKASAGEIEVVQRGSVELRGPAITEAAVYAQAQSVQAGGWFHLVLDVPGKQLTLLPPQTVVQPSGPLLKSHSGMVTAAVEDGKTVIVRRDGKPDLYLEPFAHGAIVGLAFSPADDKLAVWSRPTPKLEVWDLTPLAHDLPPQKLRGVGIGARDEIGFNDQGTLVSVKSSPRRTSWWDPVRGAFRAGLEEQIFNRLMGVDEIVQLVSDVRNRKPGYEHIERMWVHPFGGPNDEELRDPNTLRAVIQREAGSSLIPVSVAPQDTRGKEVKILIGPQRPNESLSDNTRNIGDMGQVTFKVSDAIAVLQARADFRLTAIHLGETVFDVADIDDRARPSTLEFVVTRAAPPETPDKVIITITKQGKEAWVGYQNDPRLSDLVQTEMPAYEAARRILQREITDWRTDGEKVSTNTYDLTDRSKDWSREQWIQRILLQPFMMEVKLAYSPNGQVRLLRVSDEPLPNSMIATATVGTADRYLRNPPDNFPPVQQLQDSQGNTVLDFTTSPSPLDIQKAVYRAMDNWPVRVTLLGDTAYAGDNASAGAGVHRLLRIPKAVGEILGDSKVRWLHVAFFGTMDRERKEFPFSQANLEGLLNRNARDGKVLLTIQGDEAWIARPSATGLEEEVEEYKPEDPWPWLDEIMKKVDADEITTFQRTGRMLTKTAGQLTREKIRREVSLVADKNSQGMFGWSVDGKTLHLTLLTSVPAAREAPSAAVNPSDRPKAEILMVALPGQPVQEPLMNAWTSFSDKSFPVGRSGGTMVFSPEQAWLVLQPGQKAASAGGALIVHDIQLPEQVAFGTDPVSFQNFGLDRLFGLIYNIRVRLKENAFPIAVLIRISDKDSDRAHALHQAAYTLVHAELSKFEAVGWKDNTPIDFIERNDSITPPTVHRSLGRVLQLIGKQLTASGLEEKIISLYAPAPVISVAFNRPGHEVQMAALTRDGQVLVYRGVGSRHEYRRDILSDAQSSRPALSAPIPGALRVAFRAGGAGIFVGGAYGGATFDAYYQAQSRQHPVRLGETGIHPTELPPGGAALSPDRKRLLVSAGNNRATIWNMAPEDEILFSGMTRPAAGLVAELTLDRGNISAVGYGPRGFFALGTDDGQIEIRRLIDETGGITRSVATLQRHIGSVTAVRFSPSGKYVASADRNGRIILWDTESWEPLHEMSHPAGSAVYALEFHGRHEVDRKDKQLKFKTLSLASAGDDGVIRFWDHHSGQLQSELAIQPETRVNTLAFSWDGTRLIAGLQHPVNKSFAVMAKVPSAKAGLEEGPVHVVLSNGRTKLAAGVNDSNGPLDEIDDDHPPPVSVAWDSVKEMDLAGRSPLERSLSVFGDTVEEALKFHGISADRLEQVGIATTGFGDFPAGVIMMENLPDHGLAVMQDLRAPLEQEFQRRFGRPIPVVFFNDGVAGVLGEHNLPEGALHDVQDGIFVIVGGGVGSGEMEGGKPVYAVPGVIDAFLNEIGWHTVTIDGGTTWVWRGEGATQENLVPNPASGPNEWSLEQHMGGPFLAARAVKWMQDRGRGDVFGEEIGIQMDSKQNLSKTDRPVVSSVDQQTLVLKKMTELGRQGDADALEFTRDSGRALGAGLGAFRKRFQDRAFARGRVAIGSSVGEKFGIGIDGDPFLTEVKKAIGTDDVVRTTKTGVKREWAFSMPQKLAGLEEPLREAQRAFNRVSPFFESWTPQAQPRALVVDLSGDTKLSQLAWMLSIMQAKQLDNAPEFRVVVESGSVNWLMKQWVTLDPAAAIELSDRLVTYGPGQGAAASAVERAQESLEKRGFDPATGSIQVISQLTPDLATVLRAFFTVGGLNFVTDEAYQRFEAVLKSA